MKRRLNSTGRQKITAENIAIRLIEKNGGPSCFEANLSGIAALGLDPAARVVIEAYVKTSSMRFDFGTVGAVQPPNNTDLSEIDRGAGILFRVKVIDVSGVTGRLLASSGPVRPRDESDEEDDRKSLLPMREVDLGQAIWRLDLDDRPVLLINRAIPDLAQQIMSDPVLQGAIFPIVVHEVMKTVVNGTASDDEEWVQDWLAFFSELLGEPFTTDIGDGEELEERSLRAVEAFNNGQQWASKARDSQMIAQVTYE